MSRVSNFGEIRGMNRSYPGGKFQLWPRSSLESMTPQDCAFHHFPTHRSPERAIYLGSHSFFSGWNMINCLHLMGLLPCQIQTKQTSDSRIHCVGTRNLYQLPKFSLAEVNTDMQTMHHRVIAMAMAMGSWWQNATDVFAFTEQTVDGLYVPYVQSFQVVSPGVNERGFDLYENPKRFEISMWLSLHSTDV